MTLQDYTKLLEKKEKDATLSPLEDMLMLVMNELMEIEAEKITGTEKGVHSQERLDYRSGYRSRRFDTRLGTFNLSIPKFRNSGYIPFFLRYKKRSEEALESLIIEAYVNGVSTRKIDSLAKELGVVNISQSQVSNLNQKLDQIVASFKNKKLESEYPVIWVDAVYEKIRENNVVENMAIMIVKAIKMDGTVDIIGMEIMNNESEETYTELFNSLKKRGVKKVWLCVSDSHTGLTKAIKKCWLGSVWQRCKVHFMRNILSYIPLRYRNSVAKDLKKIWQSDTRQEAIDKKNYFTNKYEKFTKAIDCLEEGFEDSIQYYNFSKFDSRKISSTNTLERLNKEIRRRSKVVGIFPSKEAYFRLMASYLVEYCEEKMCDSCYISKEIIFEQQEIIIGKTATM